MLTAADLAAMQAEQEAALPSTCTIRRASEEADGRGGTTKTWSDQETGVACRLASASLGRTEAERLVDDRLRHATIWMLTLPAGTDLRHEDRVLIDSDTYEVVALGVTGGYATACRALVVRIV